MCNNNFHILSSVQDLQNCVPLIAVASPHLVQVTELLIVPKVIIGTGGALLVACFPIIYYGMIVIYYYQYYLGSLQTSWHRFCHKNHAFYHFLHIEDESNQCSYTHH